MKLKIRNVIFTLIFTFSFIIIVYIHTLPGHPDHRATKSYQLSNEGVQVYPEVLGIKCVQQCKQLITEKKYPELKQFIHSHPQIQSLISKHISNDHQLQDYIWVVEKSAVHTCHRDNNGSFFNNGQKYPSYTMLVYLEPMEKCLGVIPKSHMSRDANNWNLRNPVVNLVCNAGDVLVFNANLIHVGTLLKKDDHLRIQLKVSHREDRESGVLGYYEDFMKVSDKSAKTPKWLRQVQMHGSCMVPYLSDITQSENIRTARRDMDKMTEVSWGQKMFSWAFYGDSDYW